MRLRKPAWIAIGIFVLTGCGVVIIWSFRHSDTRVTETAGNLIVGTTRAEHSTLIWVAERQGFFTSCGVKVQFKYYGSGFAAGKALAKGDIQIATTAEAVFAHFVFKCPDFRILASIDEADEVRLIAKRSSRIKSAADLPGKTIGLKKGSAAEYYLGRMLLFNRIDPRGVTVVDMTPEEQVKAVVNGKVDGIVTWQPHVYRVSQKLGEQGVFLPAQSGQTFYWVLVCKEALIERKSSQLKGFLKALVMAEGYLSQHEDEALDILANRLGMDMSYIKSMWPKHWFAVRLNHSLLLALESQARWETSRKIHASEVIPDFLNLIRFDFLNSIKREAVSIIR